MHQSFKKQGLLSFLLFITMQMLFAQTDWKLKLNGGFPHEMTSDSSGNVYVVGVIQSIVDFDPGFGVFTLTPYLLPNGSYTTSMYIAKFSATGLFLWAKGIHATDYEDYLFSSGDNIIRDIKVDNANNLYITGCFFKKVDFNPDTGTFIVNGRSDDSFLLKLDSDGAFQWVKTWGGEQYILNSDADMGVSLAVNDSLVYVTGFFSSTTDFDPGSGTAVLSPNESDTYVCKFDAEGNFRWVRSWGNNGSNTYPNCIGIQSNGNVIVAGSFSGSVDFDNSEGTAILTSGFNISWPNAFLIKLDPNGGLMDAGALISNRFSFINSFVIDTENSIYCSGTYAGETDFDPDADSLIVVGDLSTLSTQSRSYLCKFNSDCSLYWVNTDSTDFFNFTYLDLDLKNNTILLSGFSNPNSVSSPDEKMTFAQYSPSGENTRRIVLNETGVRSKAISSSIIDENTIYTVGFFVGSIDFDSGPDIDTLQSEGTIRRTCIAKLNLDQGEITSIQNQGGKNQVHIYPNPSSGFLILHHPIAANKIYISDQMGKLVLAVQPDQGFETRFYLPDPGVYFATIVYENHIVTQKFLVSN